MEQVQGEVCEARTFCANRFSRRHFQRQLEEVADGLGVKCSFEVRSGLLMCDVEVTATGESERVERLMEYAVGLGAASVNGQGGGGGGP